MVDLVRFLLVVSSVVQRLVVKVAGIVLNEPCVALPTFVTGLQFFGCGIGIEQPLQLGDKALALLISYQSCHLSLVGVDHEEGGIGMYVIGFGNLDALALLSINLDVDEGLVHVVAHHLLREYLARHQLAGCHSLVER